jgi:hypothetical protein
MRKVLTAFCLTVLAIGLLPINNAFALDVPTGFAATGNRGGTFTAGTVTLSWSPVTGADNGYSVQTLLNGNQVGLLAPVVGQGSNNLVVSGLQGGSEYSFKINAVSTTGVSSWSTAVAATPVTAPATPPKPTHSVSRLTATVNWSAPLSDGGSAITGYKVYLINAANSDVANVSTTSTTAEFTSEASGTYTVKVIATNIVGDSARSIGSSSATIAAASSLLLSNAANSDENAGSTSASSLPAMKSSSANL